MKGNDTHSSYLFVYGTLMQPFDTSMNCYLQRHSRFLGAAEVKGRLYDLGRYPGLRLDGVVGRSICGHVYKLDRPGEVLAILDRYEGYDPSRPEAGEYRRTRINLDWGGQVLLCWVYLYNAEVDDLPEITSGNYLDYVTQNPVHQSFINSI